MEPKSLITLLCGVAGVLVMLAVTGITEANKKNCLQYKRVETTVLKGNIAVSGIDSICICKFDKSTNQLITLKIK